MLQLLTRGMACRQEEALEFCSENNCFQSTIFIVTFGCKETRWCDFFVVVLAALTTQMQRHRHPLKRLVTIMSSGRKARTDVQKAASGLGKKHAALIDFGKWRPPCTSSERHLLG